MILSAKMATLRNANPRVDELREVVDVWKNFENTVLEPLEKVVVDKKLVETDAGPKKLAPESPGNERGREPKSTCTMKSGHCMNGTSKANLQNLVKHVDNVCG